MSWLELRIVSSAEQAPSIENALISAGALSVTFEDNADQPIFEPALGETPLWRDTRVTGLFEAQTDTAAVDRTLGLAAEQYQWQILEDKDWEREWMQYYHPIQCASHLWICPSWQAPPDPSAVNLMLDPGLAFGTGTHPTTFMCLQWLAEQALEDTSVIDYGCGSGILGIAALLLGARRAFGVDTDPQALVATRANMERNALPAERFPVYLPQQAKLSPAPVVVANILAGPLVDLAPTIGAQVAPGGSLCLSGLLIEQADAVKAAYEPTFEFTTALEQQEWACLVARRC